MLSVYKVANPTNVLKQKVYIQNKGKSTKVHVCTLIHCGPLAIFLPKGNLSDNFFLFNFIHYGECYEVLSVAEQSHQQKDNQARQENHV